MRSLLVAFMAFLAVGSVARAEGADCKIVSSGLNLVTEDAACATAEQPVACYCVFTQKCNTEAGVKFVNGSKLLGCGDKRACHEFKPFGITCADFEGE